MRVVLLFPHLLCSPHQEWNSLWWISTKRFETYKERQFSQVCYLKPGNLGIQFTHRGSRGSPWCLSGRLASGRYIEMESFRGLSNQWPTVSWDWGYHISYPFLFTILFLFSCMHVCECELWTVTMDQALSFPWVTHLITAPSFLIPNSVGRACQTAYAERRGDFEMLLMTLGYNYPLSFLLPLTLPLSCPLLSFTLAVILCLGSLLLSGWCWLEIAWKEAGRGHVESHFREMNQSGWGTGWGAKSLRG